MTAGANVDDLETVLLLGRRSEIGREGTKVTEGMSPAPMSSTPSQVADAVVRGLNSGATRVWVPRVLQPVFFVMRLLPQTIWRRMPR